MDRFFSLTFDMQCIAGLDGYFRRLNVAWENTLGYSTAELKSCPFVDFVHEDDREKTIEAAGQLSEGDGVVEFENRYRKKDGSYVWLLWNAISDIDRGLIYATARDITQRKRYEEELEKTVQLRTSEVMASEQRLQLILDNVADSIVTITEKGTIVSCNPGTEKIFGYAQDEMLGENLRILMPENEASAHDAYLDAYMKTGVASIIGVGRELEGRSKDGTIFPIDLTVSQMEVNDEILFVGVVRDISERKKAEERVHLAKESADEANRAKSEFLSSMSHELRTPMNSILGFGQLLEDNPEEPLTQDQGDSVAHIMKSGRHLLELINDVLDLAKIESGKLGVSIENILLTDVLEECLSFFEPKAKARNIDKSVAGSDLASLYIRADRTRLKQVLLNLVSNAVKYNRQNGIIKISAEETTANVLRIAVTDTGDGIPKSKQGELFKPFSRLGAENTEIEGTGIGLVVCKNLIELMNGSMGMESEVGKGSTFWFELPLSERHHDAAEATTGTVIERAQGLPPGTNITVLYVEDNTDNLMLMEKIISRVEGLSMISTHTAELGIEMAKIEKPNVIILDINLPGMNGIEALKQLRGIEITKDIPVLALSAAATKNDIERGMAAGFLRYLTKPIDIHEVMDAIKKALE